MTIRPNSEWDVVMVDFADAHHGVSLALEMLRHRHRIRHVVTKEAPQLGDSVLLRIKSRHKTRSRLPTRRIDGVGILANQSLLRQLIEMRRLHQRVAIGPNIAVQIVGDDEEHVLGRLRLVCETRGGAEKES